MLRCKEKSPSLLRSGAGSLVNGQAVLCFYDFFWQDRRAAFQVQISSGI
jgi:hypothetical protein